MCTPVDVAGSDVDSIDVQMSLGVHITGHVYGPDGQTPLDGIGVNTNGTGTQTDSNGYYSLTVASGGYTLQFNDNSGHHLSGCYNSNNPPTNFTTDQQNLCTPVQVNAVDVGPINVSMPSAV